MQKLLSPHDPHPLEAYNRGGMSDFVILCEHAGRRIPDALADLGLNEEELTRHIAWDIGAKEIAIALAERLDAPLFMQRYSRLVCDCNRRPNVGSFIPEISDSTRVPGNIGVSQEARAARIREIFDPFHDHVSAELDKRQARDRRTLLVTIHSFTPIYMGVTRPWEIGVLYHRDKKLSPAMLAMLRTETGHVIGDNQPYAVGDDTDYAIPVHGEARGLPCAEIEIRNDLTQGPANVAYWATMLADQFTRAAKDV